MRGLRRGPVFHSRGRVNSRTVPRILMRLTKNDGPKAVEVLETPRVIKNQTVQEVEVIAPVVENPVVEEVRKPKYRKNTWKTSD